MNTAIQTDISYFAQQPANQIQWLISGMAVLMQDTEGKAAAMQSQSWFQRMARTVTGKNKLTLEEIKRNHEKLNLYMAEVVAELYRINCVDQRLMMSLGTQLNEIYADHLYLKQALGAFVEKLNAKIASVDNFHMLVTEIEQGVYTTALPLSGICKVLSQFDRRILEDTRKLDIIRRSLIKQKIISEKPVLLRDHFTSILSVPMTDAGQVYLELGTIRENFIAELMMKLMENYHFLPDMARKTRNQQSLIDSIIQEENLDADAALSTQELYDDFVCSKVEVGNGLISVVSGENSTAEDDDTPIEDYEDTDGVQDMGQLFVLAEQGDADAQFAVGLFYLQDKENATDEEAIESCDQALIWFRKAAEQGQKQAQHEMGLFYLLGVIVEEDAIQAVGWFRKAATQGVALSQFELGRCYYNGDGVKKSLREAYYWFHQAAQQGHARAQFLMGTARLTGEGVQKDFEDALDWYTKAAEQEMPSALFGLGVCNYLIERKRSYQEDQTEAIKLIQCAIEHGCDVADYALKKSMKRGKIVSAVYLEAGLRLEASDICQRKRD